MAAVSVKRSILKSSQHISKSSQHISKSSQHIRPRNPSVRREKGTVTQLLPTGYSFMLRLRQIDLLFHIIVIECRYSCIPRIPMYTLPCIPMYTLCTLYTHTHAYPVYPVHPCITCIPMYTLYTQVYPVYPVYPYPCIPCIPCTPMYTLYTQVYPVYPYPSIPYIPCLVPVRRFPSPPRSIRFGDVSEASGRETPRQKRNAHAYVTFWNSKQQASRQQEILVINHSCGYL